MSAVAKSGATSLEALCGGFVIVKIGGAADVTSTRLATDIRLLTAAGVKVVVAHGGGKALSRWLRARRRASQWIDGLRVTDAPTRDAAVMVYRGMVAPALITALVDAGVSAVGIAGADGGVVRVRRRSAALGFVGDVREIRTQLLEDLCAAGHVPVVAPLGLGSRGELYNVNGDDVAGALARALQARALVFLTDVAGVMGPDGDVVAELPAARARALIRTGVINGGMVPKVRAALRVLPRVDGIWITGGAGPKVLRRTVVERRQGTRIVS